jgi:type II secretory pathway component GspD/PulD (secretin)
MIFLQPRIVRTTADLSGPTREKYDYVRELQKDSQQDTKRLIKDGDPAILPALGPDR